MPLVYENWGLIDFDEAFQKQKNYVSEIQQGLRPETIVFCCHNPVVTLGRKTQPGDVTTWQGSLVEVNRGGRATYHGPSQLVVYPLLNLNGGVDKKFPLRDIHSYLRFLEEFILDFLAQFCIDGETHSTMKSNEGDSGENATGVWVNGKKVASIGIAIQKWITSHGVAINLQNDEKAFQGIKPCGFSVEQVTNVENLIQKKIGFDEAVQIMMKLLNSYGLNPKN